MLIDATLREGAQRFGTYLDLEARKRILSGLFELGVEEVEIGWIGQPGLEELHEWAVKQAGKRAVSVWSRCRFEDAAKAARLGAARLNIGLPVSDAHIAKRLGMDREDVLGLAAETVLAARLMGVKYVSLGLEDISRADTAFALKIARAARDAGACRIRLADTVGLLSPLETARLVRTFKQELRMDLAVHCHDDFGLAGGNAMAALAAGADYADGTLLGLGERAGLAATEELAAYLALKAGNKKYRLKNIGPLCEYLAELTGEPIPRNKAVVGQGAFSCETGLHIHGVTRSPDLFEPYDPALVGRKRTIGYSGKSGRFAMRRQLKQMGITPTDKAAETLLKAVTKLSRALNRPLTGREVGGLAKSPLLKTHANS